jgi:hypothetical protein
MAAVVVTSTAPADNETERKELTFARIFKRLFLWTGVHFVIKPWSVPYNSIIPFVSWWKIAVTDTAKMAGWVE